jgi:hypothetical protein
LRAAGLTASLILLALATAAGATTAPASAPFSVHKIYDGAWNVRADHPWGGAAAGATARLDSHCERFTVYFACEQTVNGKPQILIVYTLGETGGFYTRTIAPSGLAAARGALEVNGSRWTYLDKPAAGLTGPWSKVENDIVDHDHIRFAEYESADQGMTWTQTNAGLEVRASSRPG